jgi:hypothetical protein
MRHHVVPATHTLYTEPSVSGGKDVYDVFWTSSN